MALTEEGKKKIKAPQLVALAFTALLVLCMFLPLFSATPGYEAELEWKDEFYDDFGREDFDYEDLENLSFLSFVLIGDVLADEVGTDAISVFFFVLFALYAIFALLTFIFALCRKAVPILIFSILTLLVFLFTTLIFTGVDRFSYYYNIGIGYYLIIAGTIGAFAVSIWMMVVKSKNKVRPVYQPQAPAYQPQAPVYQPQAPAYQPQAPVYQPQAPVYQPQAPVYQPQAPVYQPQAPVYQVPVQQAPAAPQAPEAPQMPDQQAPEA